MIINGKPASHFIKEGKYQNQCNHLCNEKLTSPARLPPDTVAMPAVAAGRLLLPVVRRHQQGSAVKRGALPGAAGWTGNWERKWVSCYTSQCDLAPVPEGLRRFRCSVWKHILGTNVLQQKLWARWQTYKGPSCPGPAQTEEVAARLLTFWIYNLQISLSPPRGRCQTPSV